MAKKAKAPTTHVDVSNDDDMLATPATKANPAKAKPAKARKEEDMLATKANPAKARKEEDMLATKAKPAKATFAGVKLAPGTTTPREGSAHALLQVAFKGGRTPETAESKWTFTQPRGESKVDHAFFMGYVRGAVKRGHLVKA